MDLPLGLSFYLKLHSTFTLTLSLPVSNYCLYLGILLTLSSRLILPHLYHLLIISVTTSVFMDLDANLHVISAINVLHQFIAILIHGSFYLHSLLSIMALLTLGHSFSMLFTPPTIVPWILISSFICHLLSTFR